MQEQRTGEILGLVDHILERDPQRDTRGRLQYLFACGLSTAFVTREFRYHSDVDLVLLDPNLGRSILHMVEVATPERFWGGLKLDRQTLSRSARRVDFTYLGRPRRVEVVHPAITLVQKLSDFISIPPRPKDFQDADDLISHWYRHEDCNREWLKLISRALSTLPKPKRDVTLERINRRMRVDISA